jgi:hypothetical protein
MVGDAKPYSVLQAAVADAGGTMNLRNYRQADRPSTGRGHVTFISLSGSSI